MLWVPLVGMVVVACGLSWAWIEARCFVLRSQRVEVLPPGTGSIRILHLSDLHLIPRQRRKVRWVRGLARLRPDLVILTGDSLGGTNSIPVVLDALEPFFRFSGVFVHGSNDYFGSRYRNPFGYFRGPTDKDDRSVVLPTDAMVQRLVKEGWQDLNNSRTGIEVRGTVLSLVGVDDPHIGRDRMPPPDTARGVIHLGVTHAPYARVLSAFRNEGVNLVFSGHTHGGQVRFPWIGALVTNCDLDRRKARGLSGWPGPRPDAPGGKGSMWLHVSAGLGTSPYAPIRFACRPEATLLELVAPK